MRAPAGAPSARPTMAPQPLSLPHHWPEPVGLGLLSARALLVEVEEGPWVQIEEKIGGEVNSHDSVE